MKGLNYILVLLMGVALVFISCEQEPLITPQLDKNVSSKSSSVDISTSSVDISSGDKNASYQFKAGAPFFGPPDFPLIVVAVASNGDIIEVAGEGTLTVHPKSATGIGTFAHKDADGILLGSGTWTATDLLSFQEYGPSTDLSFPREFRAGYANIRVYLDAGGGVGFDAILRLYCILPGAKVPTSTPEGILLNIPGVQNFNKVFGGEGFGGPTLYILQE